MNRTDLQRLAETRLAEASTLLRTGHPSGAYYLAGYAVECALKACIAKRTRRHDFPDKKDVDASYTHNLKTLFKVANLEDGWHKARQIDEALNRNWEAVEQWSERARYEIQSEHAARRIIEAVAAQRNGVLRWLKHYW